MRTSAKGNNARKILAYYSVNFDISPPYHVLCDGPTLFQSMKNEIYIKQALPLLLGATAYPVVTDCIVRELRSLGEEYSNAALFAKRATRVPCAHEESLSANECVIARVRTPFEKKLVLATNDIEILMTAGKLPGVPLITIVNQTKLALKSPSRFTIEHVRRRETVKTQVLGKQDQILLKKLQSEKAEAAATNRPVRKRKRVKGPNPLSVKKRKTIPEKSELQPGNSVDGTEENHHISRKDVKKTRDMSSINKKGSPLSSDVTSPHKIPQIISGKVRKPKRKRKRKAVRREEESQKTAVIPVNTKETAEDHKASCGDGNIDSAIANGASETLSKQAEAQQRLKHRSFAQETKCAQQTRTDTGNNAFHEQESSGPREASANPWQSSDEVVEKQKFDGEVHKSVETEACAIPAKSEFKSQCVRHEEAMQGNKLKGGGAKHDYDSNENDEARKCVQLTQHIMNSEAGCISTPVPEGGEQEAVLYANASMKKKQRKNRRRRPKKEAKAIVDDCD